MSVSGLYIHSVHNRWVFVLESFQMYLLQSSCGLVSVCVWGIGPFLLFFFGIGFLLLFSPGYESLAGPRGFFIAFGFCYFFFPTIFTLMQLLMYRLLPCMILILCMTGSLMPISMCIHSLDV